MLQPTDASHRPPAPLRIGFWLSEGFDFYALAAALEPLRRANEAAGHGVCEWQILSLEGQPLKASNGIATATVQLNQMQRLDVLVVCGDERETRGGKADVLEQCRQMVSQSLAVRALDRSGSWLAEHLDREDPCEAS
jgi:transcriptional regulator GlxA family with amidase domain